MGAGGVDLKPVLDKRLARGADRSEVQAAFPAWEITDVGPSYFSLPKLLEVVLRPNEEWYRLRRKWSSN
jgi:hypothetical protein